MRQLTDELLRLAVRSAPGGAQAISEIERAVRLGEMTSLAGAKQIASLRFEAL
jgi:hypothetical protein